MAELTAILQKAAPWLAAAAGGPVGIAGMALKTLAETLGATSGSMESVTSALIGATPDQIRQLKQADMEFRVRMQELGFKSEADMLRIAADDRADARKNNVASGLSQHIFWLSIVLLIVCLGSEVAVLFVGYPPALPDLVVGRVLGLLDAVAMMVLAYWYGTTAGSAKKTELLAQAPPPDSSRL